MAEPLYNYLNRPEIYVGTYGKYNAGKLTGDWVQLDQYETEEKFYDACAELHSDEHDPEFMFQDFQGIPDGYIGESHIHPSVWEWLKREPWEREVIEAYAAGVGPHEDVETILEASCGWFDTWQDYVDQYIDDTGLLDSIPEDLRGYFDAERFGRELEFDYSVVDYNRKTFVFYQF